MTQPFRELDTVVLVHDLPEAGLCAGDLGAIVHVYAPNAFEVEFAAPSGSTALRTLSADDVRIARDDEILPPHPVGGG
ncbi:MAG TPA: DUF4926 domain-containing protein [Longimicrobium sp.]|jgi:hypothetical protein|nr:DUF4926 domain-containing protein [Longimicrobium sp.]